MNMRLENKVALLTGIGQGMGRATARLFAQEGAKTALSARGEDRLKKTASQIESLGGTAIVVPGDLSERSAVDSIVKNVLDQFGKIDVLYAAAGGNFDPTRSLDDIDQTFWDSTVANTMNSLYNLAQAVRPVMKDNGGGSIVTVAASFNVRQAGNASYGAAKSAIIGMSQNLAGELHSDNIRVNTITAGLFRGKLPDGKVANAEVNLSRTGYPQDIANAALFFASDESGWVTGQTLAVDGGVDVGARGLWDHER